MTPRAKTREEVQEEFLIKVRSIAKYWSQTNGTSLEKCEGVAFSFLNIFDGTSGDLPAMSIMLDPHESDKDYCVDNDMNWYEPDMVINISTLHDKLYN